MNNPSNLFLKLLFACLLVSFSGEVGSQTFKFDEFGLEEGICDRYIYSINQDNNGYLWIGTGAGLCRFDGFEFRDDFLTDSLTKSSVVLSYKDRQGNIWFGHIDGSLSIYDGSDFIPVSIEESQKNRINDIIESDDSLLYIATQSNGILRVNASDQIQTKRLNIDDKLVYSIEQLSEYLFLIGTNNGLKIYRLNEKDTLSLSFSSIVEQIPATKIQSILKSRDNTKIWIATEYQGIYIITLNAKDPGSYQVTKANASFGLDGLNIQSLFEDIEGNIWISTFRDGLIKLVYSYDRKDFVKKQTYNTLNGMISNDVKKVFQDKEGSIWIGTYGSGIARLANEAFTFYEFDAYSGYEIEMIDGHTIEVLEFDKVKEIVAGYTISALGKERVDALAPLDDVGKIREELSRVAEFLELVSFGDPIPIRGIKDVRSALERCAIEGAMLEPKDFLDLRDTLEVIRKLEAYFISHREQYPLLSALAGGLEGHPEAEEAIGRVVDPGGEVKDSASRTLRQIRRDIELRRESLRSELDALLKRLPDQVVQDRLITLRNGRYVIPIRENQRGRVEGIVHDQSASGATVFVEPLTTLERNNQIRQLELAERREIERILRELTTRVREIRGSLIEGVRILGKLDVLYAKASYGSDFRGIAPRLNEEGRTRIPKGRHPLLCVRYRQEDHEDEVVPLDIELGTAFDTLLITGPNAGGKTVALKTVGLLTLMALSGLPVPAGEKTEIAVYRRIYADIGDEQSIENDLSTFSSRARRLAQICRKADSNTLVLLDEIGSSTDPDEGSALAMAALEHLTRRGVHTIATTHHGRLKAFAHEHERIENGSMQFDRNTLRPSFRFRLGIPGSSYAFEIAERLGMPSEIIERATTYGGADARQLEDLIGELERVQQEYEGKSQRLEHTVSEHERLQVEYEEKVRGVKQEVRVIREEALRESEEILSKANALIERTVADIRSRNADRASIVEAKTSIAKAAQKVKQRRKTLQQPKKTKPIPEVEVGDWVWAERFGGRARVIGAKKASGKMQIQIGHAKVWISLADITRVEKGGDRRSEVRGQRPEASYVGGEWGQGEVHPSLSVRGMTVDEALPKVDQYLDDAYLAHLQQVVIIHGKGTGVLREQVGSFLRQHPRVKSQRLGEWNEGGNGVTIVEMAT